MLSLFILFSVDFFSAIDEDFFFDFPLLSFFVLFGLLFRAKFFFQELFALLFSVDKFSEYFMLFIGLVVVH
jgi:hypothetical protein